MSKTKHDTGRTSDQGREHRGVTRRTFLKWSAAVGGGAAVMTGLPGLFRTISQAEAAEITDYAAGKWIRSGCNMCGGQCGIECFVDSSGVLRKIEPYRDPNQVASVSSAFTAQLALTGDKYETSGLCCKGNSARKSLYDPDRLQTPMKRVGPRGDSSSFVPITWDEAIQLAAGRLRNLTKQYGARSLFWFGEDHSFTHIQQDFLAGLGGPNYHNHSMLCDTSRKSAFRSTMGNERPLADLEHTDYLLVFGWNFLSAIKWVWLAKAFARGRAKPGFKFTYVDPVFNTTASKADTWLAVKPGTDGALALALCHRIVNAAGTGNFNEEFATKMGLGFATFKAWLNDTGAYADGTVKNAAWAAGITGLPQSSIEALADELMAAYKAGKKICIDSWSGPGHKMNATQGGRAIGMLLGLFGVIDKPGTMIVPERQGPSRLPKNSAWPAVDGWHADGTVDITTTEAATSNRTLIDKNGVTYPAGTTIPAKTPFSKKYVYGHGSGSYVDARETMITQRDFLGIPYPVKACVVVFQNLAMSMPDPERTRMALSAMEFVMVVDTHMSETALLADVVIPGSNYLERFDYNARWVTFRANNLRQPVVSSWIGGRSEAQFFMDLGGAMGLAGFKTLPAFTVDEEYNKAEWIEFMKGGWTKQMTWDELKKEGLWMEDFGAAKGGTHYEKHKKTATGKAFDAAAMEVKTFGPAGDQVFVVRNKADGKILGYATSATPTTYDEAPGILGTQSGRFQFWDPALGDAYTGKTKPGGVSVAGDVRFHPLPVYQGQLEQPTTNFPLYFISWKEVEHTHSRTFNNPWLMELRAENRLIMHPKTAEARGIEEEDAVWVQSPYGVVKAKAHLAFTIRQDTVGFVRGFGHWALGRVAMGRGAHDGWLLPARAETHSAQVANKDAICQVVKA
ncbi:MAG: molybdopterin-dependent oxidoreductase [Deltaproteobacteria bacterium]|nr:molybdopterin-dependent oxidoreductase [Deltaproteobacteria bacterium]